MRNRKRMLEQWSVRLLRVAELAQYYGGTPHFDTPGSIRVVFQGTDKSARAQFTNDAMSKYHVSIDIRGPSVLVFESYAAHLISSVCD